MPPDASSRAFKTAGFSKDAKKAKIKDTELCLAIQRVRMGQVDDLGGGVFKKRLNNNQHRANIEDDELLAFRLLAKSYAGITESQLRQLLVNGDFVEICHD